ncbi:MAG: tRNA (N6-isopentenyl adenosine(37)-C2)-methylthiotransferase MiaB, partial [Candidatus Kryptoniota bacterium]
YGCQMNDADTEVVLGIMNESGYKPTQIMDDADVVLLNTCSVREHAEEKIYQRLSVIIKHKYENPNLVVGVLGCMAERLRATLLKKHKVDVVVGPDDYRKLPQLLDGALAGTQGIGVQLSRTETYDDITPFRAVGISAWISVMRGCDKFCTFCIVPFTRGRERSRSLRGVISEVEKLIEQGFREITLLGQNVNSYRDDKYDFSDLLAAVADVDPKLRVRFTTSHPQDLSDKLIGTIANHDNLCKYIHLPVQSGSDRVLRAMNRTYTREYYLKLVGKIRSMIPGVALSTDVIAGFPGESEAEHIETLTLLDEVHYDGAYTFKYSPREGTPAYKLGDDISDEVKSRRLSEIISFQQEISYKINQSLIGKVVEIMIDGRSKKSDLQLSGRTDTNKTVIFPGERSFPGEAVKVKIERASSATLFGQTV